ncbi:FMN-linked oxidoreductase [Coniochaeta ligniaria NRRL 30616]|uniref:Dihydroorotate dehydrogenase (fumarate) n=1 Tax=Coniochaeta ligniaria NRRL 30616 TaxID=1408157 RepID=A0A1J7JGX3_9PEZI|nr:FMN-linked oxidoreductase [Coniochaeta ligniaria NRRL 30616]
MAPIKPPALDISPPLLNSANPWATTLEDLQDLYSCESTGAVTTRTSLLSGFDHDDSKHQYVFFNGADHDSVTYISSPSGPIPQNASLNSLGYSPVRLDEYLDMVKTIAHEQESPQRKWFIISVTGTPEEVAISYTHILAAQRSLPLSSFPLAMEINLSCPNIPGKPPPAYSGPALAQYLTAVFGAVKRGDDVHGLRIAVGLKTPPYTHAGQYDMLISALVGLASTNSGVCPVSFLTATNTLGSCVVLEPHAEDGFELALPEPGIGGLAGAPLHPLALGNVTVLSRMLDDHRAELGHVQIIGVGGVADAAGYKRMRAAGAVAVGVGTALGLKGVGIFEEIYGGIDGKMDEKID